MPTTADGSSFPLTGSPGVSWAQDLVNPSNLDFMVGDDPTLNILAPGNQSPNPVLAAQQPQHNYVMYLVGIVVLLVVMKYASEHEKAKMDPKILGIGVWNFMTVGILATLFLVGAKVIFAKYPIPGISQIIGAA